MRALYVALLSLLLIAVPASAAAVFSTTTSPAAMSVGTGSLGVPTNVTVPATSSGSVAVSWTAPTPAPAGTTYYVTRTSGAATSAACGTTANSRISTVSCTDTVTADGSYTYTVIAIYQSWTSTSAASTAITVHTTSGSLYFSQGPQSAKSDQSIGTVVVRLRNAAGATITTSGVRVSLVLGGSTSGTLAGTTTATTDANGAATFTGLSVDLAGTYALTASASAYTSATSSSFTVSAGSAADISVVSGSNQSTRINTGFANALVVLVTDSEGNPVANATVTFLVTSLGAAGTFSNSSTTINLVTNAAGQASATVKANGVRGSFTVYAALSLFDIATFTLTNT